MKKWTPSAVLLTVMILTAGMALAEEPFYSGYSDFQKADLALSCLMVSRQYAQVEKKDKAAAFHALALEIYPSVEEEEALLTRRAEERENKRDTEIPPPVTDKVQPGLTSPAEEVRPEVVPRPDFALKYTFNKLLRTFFMEDEDNFVLLLDSSFTPGNSEEKLTRREIKAELETLFEEKDCEAIPPAALYDTSSIIITETRPPEAGALYGTWRLQVKTLPEYQEAMSELIENWGETQEFLFRYDGSSGKWFLSRAALSQE